METIAIIEHDQTYASLVKGMYASVAGGSALCDLFYDLTAFLGGGRKRNYDLVFYGVDRLCDMANLFGVFVHDNYNARAVLMAKEEVSPECLKHNGFDDILRKDAPVWDVIRTLKRIYDKSPDAANLTFIDRGETFVVNYRELLYIQSSYHILTLTTKTGEFKTRDHYLHDNPYCTTFHALFMRVHRSAYANMMYVNTFVPAGVKMADGKILPVSRRLRERAEQKFRHYTGTDL